MSTHNTRSLTLSVPALCLLLTACAPAWTVIRQATPNPLVGKSSLAARSLELDGLRVGGETEQQYLAPRDQAQQQAWQQARAGLAERFWSELAASPGLTITRAGDSDRPVIRTRVLLVEPGYFAHISSHPTVVVARLLVASGAEVLDEVEIKVTVDAGSTATGERLEQAGSRLAAAAADYLRQRLAQP